MFTIDRRSGPFETYVLADDSVPARVEVVPERGGILTRWIVRGTDVLYFDAERFANPDLSVRGGIPVLFPICGNLPDNCYQLDGQTYELKQHGFARDLPWLALGATTDDGACLTVALDSSDRTRAVYPFEFRLQFSYCLRGMTLAVRQRFENASDRAMPFSAGLHPYFQVGDKSQLVLDIPGEEYRDRETGRTHPYSGSLDYSREELDLAFLHPQRPTAGAVDGDRGVAVEIAVDEFYSSWVFWTVKGKDYYCLEPWSAPRNALNTGDRLTLLPPGESLETLTTFTAKIG